MKHIAFAIAALFCALAAPALAADYYDSGHYITAGDGEAAVMVNGDNVRTVDGGNKATDVAIVNAGGVALVVYDVQFDCAGKAWRVTAQYDYHTSRLTAPIVRASREPPPFAPVYDGTPIQGAMKMVCGWPATMAGAAKTSASDPVSLSLAVSPTLPVKPSQIDDRPRRD